MLLANQVFRLPWTGSVEGLAASITTALSSKSAFYYLAWYAVLSLLFESDRQIRASATDVGFVLLIAMLNFLSASSVAWVSITAFGIFIVLRSARDSSLAAAAVVLMALALNGLWGPTLFDLFAIQLLQLDAALVGTLLSLTQPGMSWDQTIVGRPDGHSVFIYSPCSSFHNISLGLLCWVSVTKLVRSRWVRSDFLWASAVAGAVIVLNASRLYLMALSPEYFTYWHDGFGVVIVNWVTTLVVLAISLWGALGTRRAQ